MFHNKLEANVLRLIIWIGDTVSEMRFCMAPVGSVVCLIAFVQSLETPRARLIKRVHLNSTWRNNRIAPPQLKSATHGVLFTLCKCFYGGSRCTIR